MAQNVPQALGPRIAEEAQLLAEEKWINEALMKIKDQKNCLQIERLHLEGLKAQYDLSESSINNTPRTEHGDDTSVNLMQQPMVPSVTVVVEHNDTSMKLQEEAICNKQELNLSVTQPSFITDMHFMEFEMEEEEDEEDVEIDMNMLMNGKQ